MRQLWTVQEIGQEELPHVQGQGWWLDFAGAACEEILHVQDKRNPSEKVGAERGHQKADRLKPQSQTTSQSDHKDHSLSNSMKLSHAVWGHPRRMGHGGEV